MTQCFDIDYAIQVFDGYGFHVRDIGLLALALPRPATTVMGADVYPGFPLKFAALLESVAGFQMRLLIL